MPYVTNPTTAAQIVAAANNVLPWDFMILPFATPVTATNWNSLAADASQLFGFEMDSTGAQNATIGWDVVLAAGTWSCEICHCTANNRGIYTLGLDGTAQSNKIDGYSVGVVQNVRSNFFTGYAQASAAKVRVTLTMATKNVASGAYYGILTYLRFWRTA